MPDEHRMLLFDFEVTIETPLSSSSQSGGFPISAETLLREASRLREEVLSLLQEVAGAYTNVLNSAANQSLKDTITDIEKAQKLQSEARTRLKAAASFQAEIWLSLFEKDAAEVEASLSQAIGLHQKAMTSLNEEAELQKTAIQRLQKDIPQVEEPLEHAVQLHQEARSRLEEDIRLLEKTKESIALPDVSQIVFELNTEGAPKIVEDIQREIRKVYPRYAVQVEVFFHEGSIVAVGAILLTYVTPLAVKAGKKMLEVSKDALIKEFSQTAEFVIKKVFQRLLPRWLRNQPVTDLDVSVTSRPQEEDEQGDTDEKDTARSLARDEEKQSPTAKETQPSQSERRLNIPRYLLILIITNTVVTLIMLILLIIFAFRLL